MRGTTNESIDMEVLKACLQTHEDNPNRVKVVLEELAGGVILIWLIWKWKIKLLQSTRS